MAKPLIASEIAVSSMSVFAGDSQERLVDSGF